MKEFTPKDTRVVDVTFSHSSYQEVSGSDKITHYILQVHIVYEYSNLKGDKVAGTLIYNYDDNDLATITYDENNKATISVLDINTICDRVNDTYELKSSVVDAIKSKSLEKAKTEVDRLIKEEYVASSVYSLSGLFESSDKFPTRYSVSNIK